jgi:formate dehydrogenase subunit gamma
VTAAEAGTPIAAAPPEVPPGSRRRREVDAVVGDQVVRFDRVERWLHWTNATLVLVLIATGSIMYIGALSGLVGRRVLVERIHLWTGLALPAPFALALAGRWNRGLRRDARRLGRFLTDDWLWLRRRFRRGGALRIGKFNAGQKVNAVLVAGTLPVLFGTGILLEWNDRLSDSWRTGATFVHDWGYVGLTLLVAGHIAKALADPVAMRGMRRGLVPRRWVLHEHPRWHDELTPPPAGAPPHDA